MSDRHAIKGQSPEVVIDGIRYYKRDIIDDEVVGILNHLYTVLWSEAYYDPTTESIGKFAKPLSDKMRRLNEILKFRK